MNDLLNERHSRLRKKFSFYATAIMSKYFTNNPPSTYIFDAKDVAIIDDNFDKFYLSQIRY